MKIFSWHNYIYVSLFFFILFLRQNSCNFYNSSKTNKLESLIDVDVSPIASRKQQHRKHRILGDGDSTRRSYVHSNFLMQNEYSLLSWNLGGDVNWYPSFYCSCFAISFCKPTSDMYVERLGAAKILNTRDSNVLLHQYVPQTGLFK